MIFPAKAGWLCLALSLTVAAQGVSSLSDLDIEFTESKFALQVVAEQNSGLQQQLVLAKEQIRALTESLAIANSETEVLKRHLNEVMLKMEALGINAGGDNKSKLEQRLLKAASDLRLVQAEHEKLTDQMLKLTEAVINFVRSAESSDLNARLSLEQELRASNEVLGLPSSQAVIVQAQAPTLTDGMVVALKNELAIAVANVGAKHGVKIGMPFDVWRGDILVGSVRAVDVRESVSATVFQNLQSDKNPIMVGDRLRVQTNK